MSFRFQSRRVMLTYKSHIPKDDLIAHLNANTWETEFARCAHENGRHAGEPDAYAHTHVLVDYGRIRNSVDARRFDYNGIHPHIEPISSRGAAHWKNALVYLAKEDPENEDLKTEENKATPCENLWSHETIEDAVVKERLPLTSIPGAIAAWALRPSDYTPPPLPSEWRPWQSQVLAEISKPVEPDTPDYRKIHWICDETGGAGKSLLARALRDHYGAFTGTWGRAIDILYILASQPTLKNRTLVFDLPRKMEDRDLYSPMEDVANGCFTSTKYTPKVVTFNRGHIIVFANFLPSPFGWTRDRYDVWKIVNPRAPVVRLTLDANHQYTSDVETRDSTDESNSIATIESRIRP